MHACMSIDTNYQNILKFSQNLEQKLYNEHMIQVMKNIKHSITSNGQ